MEFNLNQLIREKIVESKSPDPYVIAGDVAAAIPSKDCCQVLAVLLPDAVREQMRALRHVAPTKKNAKSSASSGTKKAANYSARGARLQKIAQSPFTWSVCVGPRQWKFFGDCTKIEVEHVASGYFQRAADHNSLGNSYLAVAKALKDSQIVRDLDEDFVISHFAEVTP